ncbi:MAG: TetR/AcrR family transcriptional regulator [Actinobacteria bacterium]|nr:TetR/AcrR family transcriptional regulator [Actinomycetota bacterium]
MDTTRDEEPAAVARGDKRALRRRRVDATRNADSLLAAAKTVFATSGVDAPAKAITDLAGVGVGTLYRHFPQRSDLVKAVLEHEIDACAGAAAVLSSAHEPAEALRMWLLRYTELLATKHGLASALHSEDAALEGLREYFLQRLGPVVGSLLAEATARGSIRRDVSATDLLYSVALLCLPTPGEGREFNRRMVAVFIDGLRPGY